MFKTNWRAGHLDQVILLVWPNGKIKDVANFLMTFAKGCVNGEFSTYEYFFGHVANPNIDVYTDVQPAEKYCVKILVENKYGAVIKSGLGKFVNR